MSATIRTIVDDALVIVGEVAGVGVQQYADDRMFGDAVRAFNMLFKKYPWQQYRKWFRLALDGALGVVTTDSFEMVLDFEDFLGVYRDGERRPLPIMPKSMNPYTVTGTSVNFWDSLHVTDANYAKRRLQFYPVLATGYVNILARVYPLATIATNWDWQDTMYLDRDMLAYGTAFMTLATDDLNPGAADTVRNLMEMKFRDVTAGIASRPIPIDTNTTIPNDWTIVP